MRWVLPETVDQQAQALAGEFGLHPLPARILLHRGYKTPEAATAFLSDKLADLPDPFRMKGMGAAVERSWQGRLGRRVPQGAARLLLPLGSLLGPPPSAALLGTSAPALHSTWPLSRLYALMGDLSAVADDVQ